MRYYIASLKHTNNRHEHITWWGQNHCDYTPVLGDDCGEYEAAKAAALNNGSDYIAVPVHIVKELSSPEPYYKPGGRFYDRRGPVVDNTRDNWKVLIALSLKDGRAITPKPEPFKGKKRCLFTESATA